jgi:hypothetical protein
LEVIGVRRSMVAGLFALLMLGLATPAWAQAAQTTETFVVLSGRADVPQGQQVGDLVVFHGSSTVDGTVNGSLTALGEAELGILDQVADDGGVARAGRGRRFSYRQSRCQDAIAADATLPTQRHR